MRYDFTPLYRTIVGFDNLSRTIETALAQGDEQVGYPPYDIEKLDKDRYRVTMAVAGFAEQDLEIVVVDTALIVKGKSAKESADPQIAVLHRGIARRAFERRFNLADHVRVVGARLAHGLLTIELQRDVPEALKPRRIEIANSDAATARIDAQAA